MTTDPELDELADKLKAYLKQRPQNVEKLRNRIASTLAEFSAAASPKPAVRTDRPKWSDRSARKGRNPAQFVREEYQAELDAGTLTRPALKSVDHLLYNAYAAWIGPSRHPEDDLKLPKKSDEVSKELAAIDSEQSKRYLRLAGIQRMRVFRASSKQ